MPSIASLLGARAEQRERRLGDPVGLMVDDHAYLLHDAVTTRPNLLRFGWVAVDFCHRVAGSAAGIMKSKASSGRSLMNSTVTIPASAAIAIADMLDNAAQIEPGQQVVIVAARDGLYGGFNLVDECVIDWIEAAAAGRGADVSVVWMDVPARPTILWGEGKDMGTAWRIPRPVKAALAAADMIISHVFDLSYEEELREMQEVVDGGVKFVRNMATTAALMGSPWASTPYELVSEIRFQASDFGAPGDSWTITHPNGTHLSGEIDKPWDDRHFGGWERYGAYRAQLSPYRPFPEGVQVPWRTAGASGVAVVSAFGVIWARHIGLPQPFTEPVAIHVEDNRITRFEGGEEARLLTDFYKYLKRYLGEEAYLFSAIHGGIHPSARVTPLQCPSPRYRAFVEHHHWGSFHFHVGNHRDVPGMPYATHISAEFRGGELRVNDKVLYGDDRLSVASHPKVLEVAARYPDRPGLEPELWEA